MAKKILKYIDNKGNDKGYVNAENVIINQSIDELTYITLTSKDKLAIQGTVQYGNQIYEITEATKNDSDNTWDIYAVQDVRELKSALRRSVYYSSLKVDKIIQKLIAGGHTGDSASLTGVWTCSLEGVTSGSTWQNRKRDIDLDYTTLWDALQTIKETWNVEIEIDTINKTIKVYNSRGRGRTLAQQTNKFYLFEGVNISDIELTYEGDEFVNIIYGYGQKTTTETEELFSYNSTENQKATSGHSARTAYKDSNNHIIAYEYTDSVSEHSTEPTKKTTYYYYKDGNDWKGTWAATYWYDINDNYTSSENDVVKIKTHTFTKKNKKVKRTKTITKLVKVRDATVAEKTALLEKYIDDFNIDGVHVTLITSGSDVYYKTSDGSNLTILGVDDDSVYSYAYTTTRNRGYLYNEKYSDVNDLLEDAIIDVRETFQPKVNLSLTLAQIPDDYRADIQVGDSVVVKTKDDSKYTMRVLSMQYDINKPDNTILTLGTRKKSLANSQASQKKFMKKNATKTGSLTTASTNNVKNYTTVDDQGNDVTLAIVEGTYVKTKDLEQILDIANSAMNIESISADAINTGTLDASIITVKDLTAENVNLSTLNGHDVREGTLLARFLDDLVISNGGASGSANAHDIWCNAEDMADHMDPTSEKYVAFVDGDLWWESGVLSTRTEKTTLWKYDTQRRDEQTQAILKYHHPELGDTFWWPRQWDTEDLAAKCITADHISAQSINGNAIESGCLITRDFYLGGTKQLDETVTDWGLRYLGTPNSLDAKLSSLDISTTSDSQLNMWNRTGSLVGSQMKPTVVRVGDIGTDKKVKDNGQRAELKWDGFHIYDGTTEVGKFYMYNSSPTYKTKLIAHGAEIGGYDVITAGNINDQSVSYADDANYSTYAGNATNATYAAYGSHSNMTSNMYVGVNQAYSGDYRKFGYCGRDAFKAWLNGSSINIKENVNSLDNKWKQACNDLYDIEVKRWNYKKEWLNEEEEQTELIGIIAEDLNKIMPNATIKDQEGEIKSYNDRVLLNAMLVLIQDQKKQLDAQQQQIDALEARLAALEDKN